MTFKNLTLAVALTIGTSGVASSQDYNDWSTISPWGLEMQDQYGDFHYVDPYAYDSQVDVYGNVYSDYSGSMTPSAGMYDLSPTPYGGSTYTAPTYSNPYEGRTDAHGSFLKSIWD